MAIAARSEIEQNTARLLSDGNDEIEDPFADLDEDEEELQSNELII